LHCAKGTEIKPPSDGLSNTFIEMWCTFTILKGPNQGDSIFEIFLCGQRALWILVPQMWVYALPGLSNLWMILIKATPLLFLLGVKDIVYWARELGSAKTQAYAYPHPDWRLWYFLFLMVCYLLMTRLSEIVLNKLAKRLNHGQATAAGEAMRRTAQ